MEHPTLAATPDLAAFPATQTDAHRAVDCYPAFGERVHAFAEMRGAKVSVAERALEARVRAALFDTAKPDLVSFGDALLVVHVGDEVVVLGRAALTKADFVVCLCVVGVQIAESAPAVLARVCGCPFAAREAATQLAALAWMHGVPGAHGCTRKRDRGRGKLRGQRRPERRNWDRPNFRNRIRR